MTSEPEKCRIPAAVKARLVAAMLEDFETFGEPVARGGMRQRTVGDEAIDALTTLLNRYDREAGEDMRKGLGL